MNIEDVGIKRFFNYVYESIGGESNPDVETYRNRAKIITRIVFFREAVFAMWVAGKSRKATESFLSRALQTGFVWDYSEIAKWGKERQDKLIKNLHGWEYKRGRPQSRPIPWGATARWNSIINLAKELAKYPSEEAFRNAFFNGKEESAFLDATDIQRLIGKKIPFLKKATAQLIIRSMGSEAIKEDRWINEFLIYCGKSITELQRLLRESGIPYGEFDLVLWSYCEMYIHKTKLLRKHFNELNIIE